MPESVAKTILSLVILSLVILSLAILNLHTAGAIQAAELPPASGAEMVTACTGPTIGPVMPTLTGTVNPYITVAGHTLKDVTVNGATGSYHPVPYGCSSWGSLPQPPEDRLAWGELLLEGETNANPYTFDLIQLTKETSWTREEVGAWSTVQITATTANTPTLVVVSEQRLAAPIASYVTTETVDASYVNCFAITTSGGPSGEPPHLELTVETRGQTTPVNLLVAIEEKGRRPPMLLRKWYGAGEISLDLPPSDALITCTKVGTVEFTPFFSVQ